MATFFLSDILWRTKLKLMCNISKQLNYVSLGQLVIDYPSKYCYTVLRFLYMAPENDGVHN